MVQSKSHGQATIEKQWTLSGLIGNDLQVIELDAMPYAVGRRPECNLILTSQLSSGRHAEFMTSGEDLYLLDCGSTNGTFLNGRRIDGNVHVANGDRIQFADSEFVVRSTVPAPRTEGPLRTLRNRVPLNGQWAFTRFDQLMQGGVYPAYQRIVTADGVTTFGAESLARSEVSGLESPDLMFTAARRVAQEVALSQLCRRVAVANCNAHVSEKQPLFMNTHPAEDLFDHVLPNLASLRENFPAQQLVIELHEESLTSISAMQTFADELRGLDVEFAYDDFGIGQNRLLEIVQVPPHYIKFDRGLVGDLVDVPDSQLRLLQSFIETAHSSGTRTIAEGIEEQATAEICQEMGFDFIQGYLYGKPTRFPETA